MRFEFWRFDVARLHQMLAATRRIGAAIVGASVASAQKLSLKTGAAAAGALLAAGTVLYVVWPKPEALPIDAVVSTAAPVFTPVTWKPAVPAPDAPQPSYDGEPGRATDMRDPASVTRSVQRRLKEAHCYDGRVNGTWNAATRHAMAAFTEIVNARLPVDQVDPVLLVLLETHAGVTCTREALASASRREREEVASIERRRSDIEQTGRAPAPSSQSDRQNMAAVEEDATESAASVSAEEAAAVAAAAAGAHKVAKADRPRYKRKYRRAPSFSRSFRKLQRSMSRFFF